MVASALPCAVFWTAPGSAQDATPATEVRGLKAVDLFRIADTARVEGRTDDAEAIYRAMFQDVNAEVRAEARFRLGMMLSQLGRNRDAALAFRALLDEKPDAARVRLELARVLVTIGDAGAARREIRQAQATGLPPEVSLVVDQFANALRSRKPFGGSFSIAIAPDSNINRATDARTLDTIIAPFTLSEDARARSGVGMRVSTQGYARLPIMLGLDFVPRISSQANLYREKQFNDITSAVQLGLELTLPNDRLRPSIAQSYRHFGGDLYAKTQTAGLNWVHSAGQQAQFDSDFSAGRADYRTNDLQDGWIYDLSTSYERAFDARSGGSITLSGTRQTARDPGYATKSGGGGLLYWREFGKLTAFASVGARHLQADERLFLFPERRKEWLYRAGIGGTFRHATILGFAPLVRLNYERNKSTVGIYDYKRTAVDFGITRAF
jgi:hypothetical protein